MLVKNMIGENCLYLIICLQAITQNQMIILYHQKY